jgi:methylated-DNA-[protein]-cysteine S-methyltransferase
MQSFAERCYHVLRQVPAGRIITYRDLAHAIGTRAYRAVGQALHRNPYFPSVPCHRVVCSDGRVGGFALGRDRKISLLTAEGIIIENGRVANLDFFRVSLPGPIN